MTAYLFPPATPTTLTIQGTNQRFPVRRVFCVGRNYSEHVKEMGGTPEKEKPVFFTKPADAAKDNPAATPYPPMTSNFHYEGELVLALAKGGKSVSIDKALDMVFGAAAGIDFTRRDLQNEYKDKGQPWDMAKGFDDSAPCGAIVPLADFGDFAGKELRTSVNGEKRQQSSLDAMILSPAALLAALSEYVELKAGDLVFTGTPAGVGKVGPGDTVTVSIDGLPELKTTIR